MARIFDITLTPQSALLAASTLPSPIDGVHVHLLTSQADEGLPPCSARTPPADNVQVEALIGDAGVVVTAHYTTTAAASGPSGDTPPLLTHLYLSVAVPPDTAAADTPVAAHLAPSVNSAYQWSAPAVDVPLHPAAGGGPHSHGGSSGSGGGGDGSSRVGGLAALSTSACIGADVLGAAAVGVSFVLRTAAGGWARAAGGRDWYVGGGKAVQGALDAPFDLHPVGGHAVREDPGGSGSNGRGGWRWVRRRTLWLHRVKPFWMTPTVGDSADAVPPETQLAITRYVEWEDRQVRGHEAYVVLLPLVDARARTRACLTSGVGSGGGGGGGGGGDGMSMAVTVTAGGTGGVPASSLDRPARLLVVAAAAAAAAPAVSRLGVHDVVDAAFGAAASLLGTFTTRAAKMAALAAPGGGGAAWAASPLLSRVGACTWDAHPTGVTASEVAALATAASSRLPHRARLGYILLDDGWQAVTPPGENRGVGGGRRLAHLGAAPAFGAGGLAPVTRRLAADGTVTGVWMALPGGYWRGVTATAAACVAGKGVAVADVDAVFAGGLRAASGGGGGMEMALWEGAYGVPTSVRGPRRLLRAVVGTAAAAGVGGLKVDGQALVAGLCGPAATRVATVRRWRRAVRAAVADTGMGWVVECMAHVNDILLMSGDGSGGACGSGGDSDDSGCSDNDSGEDRQRDSVRRDAAGGGSGVSSTRTAVLHAAPWPVTAWRTSDDHAFPPYPEPPSATAAHLAVNAAVSLYLGALFPVPDWDMFRAVPGRGLASPAQLPPGGGDAARHGSAAETAAAVAGVSDGEDRNLGLPALAGALDASGRLVRPLLPARPTADSVFVAPTAEPVALKVWTVNAVNGVVGAFHLYAAADHHAEGDGCGGNDGNPANAAVAPPPVLTTTIFATDVPLAPYAPPVRTVGWVYPSGAVVSLPAVVRLMQPLDWVAVAVVPVLDVGGGDSNRGGFAALGVDDLINGGGAVNAAAVSPSSDTVSVTVQGGCGGMRFWWWTTDAVAVVAVSVAGGNGTLRVVDAHLRDGNLGGHLGWVQLPPLADAPEGGGDEPPPPFVLTFAFGGG
ncbi:hypothetical protein MMPV_009160 [Pyropia vietnamensis]